MRRDYIGRRHISGLCRMEERSAGRDAWGSKDYARMLQQSNAIGYVMTTEGQDRMTGVVLFRYEQHGIEVDRLLVDIDCRLGGIGADLLARVCTRAEQRRMPVFVTCDERDKDARGFLDRCGFTLASAEVTNGSKHRTLLMQWSGFNDQVLDELSAEWIAGRAYHSRLARKGK